MLDMAPPVAGFTTWSAEGHGFGFSGASVSERVRGRVKRSVIVAVIRRRDATALLQAVSTRAPAPHLTYWTEPVDGFGRMHSGEVSTTDVIQLASTHSSADPTS
jgi:hypothetical protein